MSGSSPPAWSKRCPQCAQKRASSDGRGVSQRGHGWAVTGERPRSIVRPPQRWPAIDGERARGLKRYARGLERYARGSKQRARAIGKVDTPHREGGHGLSGGWTHPSGRVDTGRRKCVHAGSFHPYTGSPNYLAGSMGWGPRRSVSAARSGHVRSRRAHAAASARRAAVTSAVAGPTRQRQRGAQRSRPQSPGPRGSVSAARSGHVRSTQSGIDCRPDRCAPC